MGDERVDESSTVGSGPGGAPVSGSAASRRRLLGWMSRAFLSLWGLGIAWVVAAFLKPPRHGLAERAIEVGAVDSIPVGGARLVRHGREPVFVVRIAEGEFVALAGVCTHLRCILNWDADRRSLVCPCHDGVFDLNGNVLQGPPPRPLPRYRVETQLGRIYLRL